MSTSAKPKQHLFANFDQPRLPLWAKLVICFGLGVACAIAAPLIIRQQYFASLTERIETIAYLISPNRVDTLVNNKSSSDEDYATLKQRLKKVKSVNHEVRFIYLMGRHADKSVYFLVDSEDPGSDGFSPRGQAYPEASPALIAMFDNGAPLIEGPIGDRWGSWLSVLAPIKAESSGKTIGVVGLDIPTTTYATTIGASIAIPLVGSLLIGTIIYMTDRVRRRRQETLRMRGELVSIASHELRSPLTGIRWGEEILLNAQLAENEAKILASMHDSTLQLQESIDDILQLASLEAASAQQRTRLSTNLVSLIEGILVMQQLPAQQKDITLQYGPNWPALVMANVDPLPMKRTFNNLISNAIKYSLPHTSVTIDYEIIDNHHVFTVSDRGIGIPKSEQTKVFDGFYRASNALKQNVIGTGMGLYLSRNVVEQHGGKLWLTSEEGKGTTVYVQLPK